MNEAQKQLFDHINNLFEHVALKELKPISLNLSKKYQTQKHKFFSSDKERLAYIGSRMPATFKAIEYVLKEIKNICPNIKIKSALDLGAGAGTSAWALLSLFLIDQLPNIHLVEQDEKMILFGKNLMNNIENFSKKITFEKNNLLKIQKYDFDLVLLSYVACELKNSAIETIIERFSDSKSKIIVFIEPGTKIGFQNIKSIRQNLIDRGFRVIAPCPNNLKCPMPKNDWCHFYVRVKRSKIHKYLKGGTLGYEDEKFSYVIATKQQRTSPKARVLRFASKNRSAITLTLCKDGKMLKEKILRKDKKRYKIAKKTNWGDTFDV